MRHRLLVCLLAVILGLSGCASAFTARTDMPFNGDITFHGITLNVPKSFIRDSTQSDEDFWVFERDWYSAVLLLSHNIPADADTAIDEYTAFMESIGAEISSDALLNTQAAVFAYSIEDIFCREIMFAHRGSVYSIALRGGDDAEFESILDTIAPSHAAANNARNNIRNSILKDILQ